MHERIVHKVSDMVVSEQIRCNDKIRKMAMQVTNLDSFNEMQKNLGALPRKQLEDVQANKPEPTASSEQAK